MDLDIGLCVPVLNEAAAVGPLLDSLSASLKSSRHTVLFVDDGSTDGTRSLVAERARDDGRIVLLEHRKSGPGCRRGAASRAGMQWLLSNTSHAVFADVDADGANPPSELAPAAAVLAGGRADVVIASKYVPGSVVTGRPWPRRAGSRLYSAALRALIDPRIHDYSNSFRIYRRAAAESLLRFEPRYESPVYLVEMVAAWLSQGIRIVEAPTTYRERSTGASKVVPSDFLRGAMGALDVGIAYRWGRYKSPGSASPGG
jgi:dolichol-phosphate mannosyltransferase